ncbi:MAG: adenosylcobalamin-dependent ribonucleoside-diphosphate reductase, partial [Bacteroidota bacterium]
CITITLQLRLMLMIQSGLDAKEAYATVSGQNSNNSVRVSDAFMQSLRRSGSWNLKNRSSEMVKESVSAKGLWERMSKAAWMCGDPGIQFDSTINKWNTCKASGRIHASNPCSEYMFLDDTACNLASINLNLFRNEQNRFDTNAFLHATRLWTIVLDISVLMGQFPSKEVAEQIWRFRTLGLGFTGLGAMLMSMGLAYDSEESRHLATAITATMTGQVYLTSVEMAKNLGSFTGFELNKSSMLEVMIMHRDALGIATKTKTNSQLLEVAARIWDQIINRGSKTGFRNAQVSCIAPTGTIGLLMDSDTTGIEPLFAPVALKHLSDGGAMQQSAICVEQGLRALGFPKKSIEKQMDYLKKHGVMDISQFSNPQHISVFQCATGSDLGLSPITVTGHLLMMSAVQPFLSGAISKTVNLPQQATVEQVADCFLKAHRLGLKSIAVYREGSKRIQPLNQVNDSSGYAIEDEGCCSIPLQNKKMSNRHSILL